MIRKCYGEGNLAEAGKLCQLNWLLTLKTYGDKPRLTDSYTDLTILIAASDLDVGHLRNIAELIRHLWTVVIATGFPRFPLSTSPHPYFSSLEAGFVFSTWC
ncbi:hypothetical protein KIL84_018928 [Mauremys mutica]|uniref:Uncharacterized protein n=1 Tax=Mauremys mutica TaxID=74926 RepID=A0A9D4BAR0_9SAUR|nr:hypothetical protein KIL84_018928 [Mauremys mutica]